MEKHPRQHNSYRLNIRVIEEVSVWRNKEDAHGGPGYYLEELLLAHMNTGIDTTKLPAVISQVTRGEHNIMTRKDL